MPFESLDSQKILGGSPGGNNENLFRNGDPEGIHLEVVREI